MSLPHEIQERLKGGSIKVPLKSEQPEQVIIEGKTVIPFGTLVQLILKKKVQTLFKDWQDEPMIFSSLLLTKMASAPNDTTENRTKLILTTLVAGFLGGVCIAAITLLILSILGVTIGQQELVAVIGVFLLVAVAVFAAMRINTSKHTQKLVEQIENMAEMFSK